jgi:hypothetical protein
VLGNYASAAMYASPPPGSTSPSAGLSGESYDLGSGRTPSPSVEAEHGMVESTAIPLPMQVGAQSRGEWKLRVVNQDD